MKKALQRSCITAVLASLAACATSPSATDLYTAQSGEVAEGSLVLFVAVEGDLGGHRQLISGSIFHSTDRPTPGDAPKGAEALLISEELAVFSKALLNPDEKATASSYFSLLAVEASNLAMEIFGALQTRLNLSVTLEEDKLGIDELHVSQIRQNYLGVKFHIPKSIVLSERRQTAFSGLLAHEIYHAFDYARESAYGATAAGRNAPELRRALAEAAATLFGQCVSLKASGKAVQEFRVEINGRADNVMRDDELADMLTTELIGRQPSEVIAIGNAAANTVWSSLISSSRSVSAGTQEAATLSSLCTSGFIGEAMNLVPLLKKIADDGFNAAALP